MEFSKEEDGTKYEVEVPATADVLAVAEILIQLPILIEREPISSKITFMRWGAKRSRGSRTPLNVEDNRPCSVPCPSKMWAEASSPDTPLIVSYSGDGVDPKSASAPGTKKKKKSVKRAMEELRRAELEAQKENDFLKGVINDLKRKMDCERSLNIELKKRRQNRLFTSQWEKNVNTKLTLKVPCAEVFSHHVPSHEPSISDQNSVIGPEYAVGSADGQSSRAGVALLNFGPTPVLDLNLLAEENVAACEPALPEKPVYGCRMLNRAAAAEARMRRRYILKAKIRRL